MWCTAVSRLWRGAVGSSRAEVWKVVSGSFRTHTTGVARTLGVVEPERWSVAAPGNRRRNPLAGRLPFGCREEFFRSWRRVAATNGESSNWRLLRLVRGCR